MYERIAVASKNGALARHDFGHADEFTVYENREGRVERVEVRRGRPAHGPRGQNLGHLAEIIALLSDCQAVMAGGIEFGARVLLAQRGIRPYEDPALNEDTVRRMAASWFDPRPREALAA